MGENEKEGLKLDSFVIGIQLHIKTGKKVLLDQSWVLVDEHAP